MLEIARFEVSDSLTFHAIVEGPLISYAHFHFYCMECGKVWGYRKLASVSKRLAHFARDPWHHYIPRDCYEHGDGSLIEHEDDLNSLPRELLEYEFLRMIHQQGIANG